MALDVALLRASFTEAVDRRPDLAHVFYQQLFCRYPYLQPLFQGADIEVQERMLGEAVAAVLDHLEDAPWLQANLAALGARHVHYQVTPEMYGLVAGTLVDTLASVMPDAWSEAHTTAWKGALDAVAQLMLSSYPGAPRETSARGASG